MSYIFSSLLSLFLLSFVTNVTNAANLRVNVNQTKLTIQKNSKSVLTFTLDEPIICPYTSSYDCKVTLLLTNPNPAKISLDVCQLNWNWNEWTKPKYVTISAVENFINDMPFSGTIVTSPIISKSEYYSGFNPVDISVQTVFRPSATCSGTGNPHYTTFDGAYWHVYWAGTYVMYKSTQRQFEVQVATRSYPSQHCGFAARENNDVVVVYACDGKMIQRRTCGSSTCISGSFPKVSVSGSSFSVQFASGASATLNYYNSIYGNMYVTAPGQDYMSTVGVCGNFNGIKSDDAPAHNFFATSPNQMPAGTIPSYDLFNWYPSGTVDEVIQPAAFKCPYVAPPVILPILNNPNVEDITNLIKENTQKISTPVTFIITEKPITIERDVMFATCNKVIGESLIAKTCIEVMPDFDITGYIDSCTEDMFLSNGDISFIQTAIDGLIQDCKSEANRDTNTWVKDEEGNLIQPNIEIQVNLCPVVNNKICSGNGNCVQAACSCNDGFTGNDCSINKLLPPTITSQSEFTCDTHGLLQCPTEISVYGTNFWNSPNLRCIFGNLTTSAFYMGSLQVICKVPSVYVKGVNSIKLPVSIQTDVNIVSKSVTNFTFYDATCNLCNSSTCVTNPTSCNINGKCYLHTQIGSNDNVCLKCLSDKSITSFSYDYTSSSDCGPKFEQTFMNARIVGSSTKGQVFFVISAKNPLVMNDPLNKIVYRITNGASLFGINPNSGELFTTYDVKISDLPKNFINNILVTATDNANNTVSAQVLVNLIPTNNNPIFSSDYYTFRINETVPVGSVVGLIMANDTDSGEFGSIRYELNYVGAVQGVGYNFQVDSTNGAITSTSLLDFYDVPSYEYIATARDGGGQYYMSHVQINLNMINKPPTKISLNNTNVKELQPISTQVGMILVTDREDKVFRYELVENNNFKIMDGKLLTNKIFSYGSDSNPQQVKIRVYDSVNNSFTQTVQVNIIQVNKPPFNIGLTKTVFPENSKTSTILAEIFYTELDPNQKVFCSISSVDSEPFIISQNYLVITQSLNYANRKFYNLTITCVDDGEPSMMGVTYVSVNITYVPQAPSDVTFTSQMIPEYSPINSLVGTLKVTTVDFNTTDIDIKMLDSSYILNYKECMKNQPYGIFCRVNVYSNTTLDYENPIPLKFIVNSNNGVSAEYKLNVPLRDVNEAPTGIIWIKRVIDETGGIFTIEDPDSFNKFEVSTTTPGFDISTNDGELFKITTNNIVYYDTNFTISIIVKNDNFVNNFSTYVNVAKAPIKIWADIVGRKFINLNETQKLQTKIGRVVLSNLDTKNYVYSCTTNSNYVSIDKNLNEIILKSKLDYYTKTIVTFPVTCTFVYVGQGITNNIILPVSSNLDINVGFVDSSPYSIHQSYMINLDRDTNLGTTLNVIPPIDVKDREGEKIIFGLEVDQTSFEDIIKINSDTGRIYVGKILSTFHEKFKQNNTINMRLRLFDGINTAFYPITVYITDGCSFNPCGKYKCLPKFKTYECECGNGRYSLNCTEMFTLGATNIANNKMSESSLIGIVIGSVALFTILVAISIVYFKKSKQNKNDYDKENMISVDNPTFIHPYAIVNQPTDSFSNPIYFGKEKLVPGMTNPLYSWYNPELTRADSEAYLQDKEVGTFLVHDSKATPGWHIFSVKSEKGIFHEKIKYCEDGLYEMVPSIENNPQPRFYDLASLVEYYTSSIVNPIYVMNDEHIYKVVTSNRLSRVSEFNRKVYLEEDPNAPPLPLKEKYKKQMEESNNITLI